MPVGPEAREPCPENAVAGPQFGPLDGLTEHGLFGDNYPSPLAELAKRSPELVFTSLAHLIDLEWLREAYRCTRKDGAAGVDGQTAADLAAKRLCVPNRSSRIPMTELA